MSRILLDQNVPYPLTRNLPGHEVVHASIAGWSELANGLLLAAAEAAGFALMITCDQNLRYQQNLVGRTLALIVLETNHWQTIRPQLEAVTVTIKAAREGSYASISFQRPPLRRRPFKPPPRQ